MPATKIVTVLLWFSLEAFAKTFNELKPMMALQVQCSLITRDIYHGILILVWFWFDGDNLKFSNN
jgi:hypothetical protein